MFGYYVQLALHGFRRSLELTALMVIIMLVGVAASMTAYAVFRAVPGDPLPDRSAQLCVPQIDNAGPQNGTTRNQLPKALTYTTSRPWAPGASPRRSSCRRCCPPTWLRRAPGRFDAYASNAYPLGTGGWSKGVRSTPQHVLVPALRALRLPPGGNAFALMCASRSR